MQWLLIYIQTYIFEQNQKCDSQNTKEREFKLEQQQQQNCWTWQSAHYFTVCSSSFYVVIFLSWKKKLEEREETFLHPLAKATEYGASVCMFDNGNFAHNTSIIGAHVLKVFFYVYTRPRVCESVNQYNAHLKFIFQLMLMLVHFWNILWYV